MKYEQREYKGVRINLMRMADKHGWIATVEGKDYGNYLTVEYPERWSKEEIERTVLEHFGVLFQNAQNTIDGLVI